MIVDGERLSRAQVRRLVEMVNKDAKEIAGQFYDQCRRGLMGDAGRSEKFRAFWSEIGFRCGTDPQTCFVESQYEKFIEDVRSHYAHLLTQPHVAEADKQKMHQALIVQAMLGANSQRIPIQVTRDSQNFAGDRFENREIASVHGNHVEPSMVARLMNSTAHSTKH